jgi:hypothetical protein
VDSVNWHRVMTVTVRVRVRSAMVAAGSGELWDSLLLFECALLDSSCHSLQKSLVVGSLGNPLILQWW